MFIRRLRPHAQNAVVDVEGVAVSILERLWHQACTGAKRGDIGKYDDELIAEECGWLGDARLIIGMLIESRYLLRHPEHRLIINDWHEHAPNHIKGCVTKIGGFVTQVADNAPRTVADLATNPELPATAANPEPPTPIPPPPNQTNSNQFNPNQTNLKSAADGIETVLGDAGVKVEVRKLAEKLAERGMTVDQVLEAVRWMEHNRRLLTKPPAALVAFLRDGNWPAEMKEPPTAEQTANRERLKRIEAAKNVRDDVLYQTRGQDDDVRKAAVCKAVPPDLLEQIGGWCGNDLVPAQREAAGA